MKKLIRIGKDINSQYINGLKNAEKEIDGITADFSLIGDIFYDIDGEFKFLDKNKKIDNYDFFWFAGKPKEYTDCLKYFLGLRNKKVIDESS